MYLSSNYHMNFSLFNRCSCLLFELFCPHLIYLYLLQMTIKGGLFILVLTALVVRSSTKASSAEYSAEGPTEYSASRRFNRRFSRRLKTNADFALTIGQMQTSKETNQAGVASTWSSVIIIYARTGKGEGGICCYSEP